MPQGPTTPHPLPARPYYTLIPVAPCIVGAFVAARPYLNGIGGIPVASFSQQSVIESGNDKAALFTSPSAKNTRHPLPPQLYAPHQNGKHSHRAPHPHTGY